MTFLVYGANGYTGELITRFAAERGLTPVLAGRNEAKVRELAERHGFRHRAFSLDDPGDRPCRPDRQMLITGFAQRHRRPRLQ